jgi:hypothetical protein
MRAPVSKRNKDTAAIEEASRQLRPLFIDVTSWSKREADTNNPKRELESALALVETFVNDSDLDGHPFAEIVRKAAIPVLRRARPPVGRRGRHSDLNAMRNQRIAATVAAIQEQFNLSQEQASWVVSKALRDLWAEHRKAFKGFEKRGADPASINKCLEFIDKLKLKEDTIEDIAKKYRM